MFLGTVAVSSAATARCLKLSGQLLSTVTAKRWVDDDAHTMRNV